MKYKKIFFLTTVSISLAGIVACSEERPATEYELSVAKEWQTCAQQEKWDKVYNEVGTIGRNIAVRNECGAEPPYVPDD